jgi:hypothetical protein
VRGAGCWDRVLLLELMEGPFQLMRQACLCPVQHLGSAADDAGARTEKARMFVYAGIGQDATGRGFWELFWEPGSSRSSSAGGGEAFAERVQHGASFIVEVAGGSISSDAACLVRFRCESVAAFYNCTLYSGGRYYMGMRTDALSGLAQPWTLLVPAAIQPRQHMLSASIELSEQPGFEPISTG